MLKVDLLLVSFHRISETAFCSFVECLIALTTVKTFQKVMICCELPLKGLPKGHHMSRNGG